MEQTISSIVKLIQPNEGTSISFNNRVIELYNSFLSEEHYDTDDIATLVSEILVTELNESLNGDVSDHTEDIMGCRMIYDIFDICKEHVRWVNLQHDKAKFAEAAIKAYKEDGNKIKAHWCAVTSPR